jgi:hypothetical protein
MPDVLLERIWNIIQALRPSAPKGAGGGGGGPGEGGSCWCGRAPETCALLWVASSAWEGHLLLGRLLHGPMVCAHCCWLSVVCAVPTAGVELSDHAYASMAVCRVRGRRSQLQVHSHAGTTPLRSQRLL